MLRRRLMMMLGQEEEEMEWKTLQAPTAIGEDQRIINFDIPDAKEVMLVFYGRANDADDSLSNSNDTNSVAINDMTAFTGCFTYRRVSGTCFHTVMRAITQNGYIDGYVNPKGNVGIYGFNSLLTGEAIKSIKLITNYLFKAESTVAIYYR